MDEWKDGRKEVTQGRQKGRKDAKKGRKEARIWEDTRGWEG
jgi:hypothetical protein